MENGISDFTCAEEMNKILISDNSGNVIVFDPETGVTENVEFSVFIRSISFHGNRLLSDSTLYEILETSDWAEPISFTATVQRSSPLGRLHTAAPPRHPVQKPNPKNILFHSKVKSSNYGKLAPKRKMFQPMLATRVKTKTSKKLKSQTIKLTNFDYPNGECVGTIQSPFQNVPGICRGAKSGNLIVADGNDIISLKPTGESKPIAAVDSPVTAVCLNTDFMAISTSKSVSLWSKTDTTKPRAHSTTPTHHLLNICNNLSYCTAYENDLNFLKFEPGTKSVLDRRGIGGGKSVSTFSFNRFHEITTMCGKFDSNCAVIFGSDSSISIFDLAQGDVTYDITYGCLGRCHWSHMVDQNTFLLMGLNTGK